MKKIVINNCIGGFGISDKAMLFIKEFGGNESNQYKINRDNPILIDAIEKLGEEANGFLARLIIVEIPDDVDWEIVENDKGGEHVAEKHRTWY